MNSLQCKMARSALSMGVRDLADLAQVSPNTIARLERGEKLKESTVLAIKEVLEQEGLNFIEENGGGPGVRLALRIRACPRCGLDIEYGHGDAMCMACCEVATGDEFEKYRKADAASLLDIHEWAEKNTYGYKNPHTTKKAGKDE